MKHVKLLIVCLIVCCQFITAQVSNAKLQWKRNTHGLAYEEEIAIKGHRDPANGNLFILYQGGVNYGLVKFDNSGASVMHFKRNATTLYPTFGTDFIQTAGSQDLVICGKKGFVGNLMKISTNGDSIWEFDNTIQPAWLASNTNSFLCVTELQNGSIVAGGDKADTSLICSVSPGGTLNWRRLYTPANYGIGQVLGIQTDNFNNIYTCGALKNSAGDYDAFVSVFNQSGTLLWERFIQGAAGANDSATKILVDNSGNVYVGGIIKDSSATNNSTFLVKYNASGGLQYMRKFHQAGQINAKLGGINYDAGGNAVLSSNSYTDPAHAAICVQKFNMAGSLQWTSSYVSNFSFVHQENIAGKPVFDAFGNICVSGKTKWNLADNGELVLLKLNAAGTQLWDRIYDNPSNSGDHPVDLLTDNNGNSYFVASMGGSYNQPRNATLLKYTSAGTLQWETIFDSPGNANDWAVQMIRDGNSIYTLGLITNQGSGSDMMLNKYNSQGTLLWQVTYDDNAYGESVHRMVMDNQKNMYVLVTNDQSRLLKYDSLGSLIWIQSYPPADGFYSGIGIDPSQNIYLVNSSPPGNTGNYTEGEYIARKVDPNGNTIYQGSPVPGNRNFLGASCKVSATGEVYAFGLMAITPVAQYMHITKFTPAGTVDWGYDVPGLDSSGGFYAMQMEFDGAGNLIVFANVKHTGSPDPYYCLLKIAPNGSVVWRNDYLTDISNQYTEGFHLDAYGNIWLGGGFNVYKFSSQTGNYISDFYLGGNIGNPKLVRRYQQNELLMVATKDAYTTALLKTDTLGNRIWLQEYNNFNLLPIFSPSMEFDQQGRIYISATSAEAEGNQGDIILLKYCDLPVPSISTNGPYQNLCPGNPVTLTAGAGISYLWNPSHTTQQTFSTDTTAAAYAFVYEPDGCYQSTDTIQVTQKLTPATPSICLVTVDSLSTHNIIVWDKTAITGAIAFNIYREDVTNQYSYVGTVLYDSLSEFHDYGANPNVTTKRYKISAIDSCGQESDKSLYHNTIYISDNGLGQFSWNPRYTIEPNILPVNNYLLMREDVAFSGVWNQVASTAGTQFVINDPNYASFPNGRWRVETAWNLSCLSTRGAINTSRSNIRSPSSLIGMKDVAMEMDFSVSPNPANNQLTIRTGRLSGTTTLTIYNTLGQKVLTTTLESQDTTLNIGTLEAGTYIVEVSGDQKPSIKKLIKY